MRPVRGRNGPAAGEPGAGGWIAGHIVAGIVEVTERRSSKAKREVHRGLENSPTWTASRR